MTRAATVLLVLVAACASQRVGSGNHVAAHQEITALKTVFAGAKNGASGAPVDALVISGAVTNKGGSPMHCGPDLFLLIDRSDNAFPPSTGSCDVPTIGPGRVSVFNITFKTLPSAPLELRFEQNDGTYEAHAIVIPQQ